MPSRCAIWARVSTDDQDSGNQLAELRAWAGRRGLDIAAEYVVDGASAWNGGYRGQLAEALACARTGGYDVLLAWALDRLSREGRRGHLGPAAPVPRGRGSGVVAARAVDRDRRPVDG